MSWIIFALYFKSVSDHRIAMWIIRIITSRQRNWEKVMFQSCLSVSQSFCPLGRGPMWPLPMMHWSSTYRYSPSLAPLDMGLRLRGTIWTPGTCVKLVRVLTQRESATAAVSSSLGMHCDAWKLGEGGWLISKRHHIHNVSNLTLDAAVDVQCVHNIRLGPNCPGIPRHVKTCSLWSTYGWQAGGSHPTRILSCCLNVFRLSQANLPDNADTCRHTC